MLERAELLFQYTYDSDIYRFTKRKWLLYHVHCWKSVNIRAITK